MVITVSEARRRWASTARRVWVLFRNNAPGMFAYDTKEAAERVASKGHEVVELVAQAELSASISEAMAAMQEHAAESQRQRFGVELFVRAFSEAEVLPSGYLRLHGHVIHLSELHRLARAAVATLDGREFR